jgi:hypothetical protein
VHVRHGDSRCPLPTKVEAAIPKLRTKQPNLKLSAYSQDDDFVEAHLLTEKLVQGQVSQAMTFSDDLLT